jgi:hypothetical protein
MPPVDLADFTSYDLGRLLEHLERKLAELGRDAYGTHLLWGGVQEFLPFDQRVGRCWADEAFAARYRWLRARVIPEGAKHDYPLGDVVTTLRELLAERVDLDPADDEEPF